jgi:hypothetical protein
MDKVRIGSQFRDLSAAALFPTPLSRLLLRQLLQVCLSGQGYNLHLPSVSLSFDFDTQSMHDLCMATKTISIEIDAYELLVRERKDPKESFSRVIRRVLSERPALTAGDLLDAMKAFEGRGAGPRRRRSRDAAA